MAVISDQGSPEYYELRAIEEIHAARSYRNGIEHDEFLRGIPSGQSNGPSPYENHIIKALQLLLLAGIYSDHGPTKTP